MTLRPFHVAFPVYDLTATRQFYETVLGCTVGRTAERWIDFNLFGHQITAHQVEPPVPASTEEPSCPSSGPGQPTNPVDGQQVPAQHWGVILTMDEWQALADRLKDHGVAFVIEPYIRFQGQVGEQATLFFLDPSGNALEFKAFADDGRIFATDP